MKKLAFVLCTLVIAGCTITSAAVAAAGSPVVYVCASDRAFAVELLEGGRARVTTSAGRFELSSRPSSLGLRFDGEDATLIIDEDRAALNGLPGGPFRRCRAATAVAPASIPDAVLPLDRPSQPNLSQRLVDSQGASGPPNLPLGGPLELALSAS